MLKTLVTLNLGVGGGWELSRLLHGEDTEAGGRHWGAGGRVRDGATLSLRTHTPTSAGHQGTGFKRPTLRSSVSGCSKKGRGRTEHTESGQPGEVVQPDPSTQGRNQGSARQVVAVAKGMVSQGRWGDARKLGPCCTLPAGRSGSRECWGHVRGHMCKGSVS